MLHTNKTEVQHVAYKRCLQKPVRTFCMLLIHKPRALEHFEPSTSEAPNFSSWPELRIHWSYEHETTRMSGDSCRLYCSCLTQLPCLVTGIMSSAGHFHMYPVTRIESTKTLDIGRNFSYFLNLQYESRRLSSYLFKVDIDRLIAQLEDGRTDGRNTFSSLESNDETRRYRKISVVCSADVEVQTDDC